MTCPLCDAEFERAALLDADGDTPELRGFRCPQGHGVFLPSDLYFAWRDRYEPSPEADAMVPPSDEVGDVKRAKLCPQDGRIMRRYRVSPEGGFWLDRCGACGGVWFDGDEWKATAAAGLLDRLPTLFSDAWQRQIEQSSSTRYWDDRLRDRIGADDLARVDDFREWAWGHPERSLIMARLGERPDETADAEVPEAA